MTKVITCSHKKLKKLFVQIYNGIQMKTIKKIKRKINKKINKIQTLILFSKEIQSIHSRIPHDPYDSLH